MYNSGKLTFLQIANLLNCRKISLLTTLNSGADEKPAGYN